MVGAPCTFARWKRTDDGEVVEEVVIVSTDIDAPKATAFAKVTGQPLNARDR